MPAQMPSPGENQIYSLLDDISNQLAGLPDMQKDRIEADLRAIRSSIEDGAITSGEGRYRELAESIRDGFFELDRDWRFTYMNQLAANNAGFAPHELIGKNIWETFPYILATSHERYYRQVMEQRQPANFEIADAFTDQWYGIRVYPSQTGISIFWVDISEHKRAEALLQQSLVEAEEGRQMLTALMEYLPEGITIADANDITIQMVSRHGQEMLGGPHDQMTAEQVAGEWKVYDQDGVTPLPTEQLPLVRAIVRGEVVKNQDLVQVNLQGQRLYLTCNAGPIRDASGTITGGIVAWRDISDRKRVELALRASEDKFARAFKFSPAAMSITRAADAVKIDVNESFCNLVGYSREELIGHTSVELGLYTEQTRQAFVVRPFNEQGSVRQMEFPLVSRDGSQHTVLYSLDPIMVDGELCKLATLIDITERKRAEERLAYQASLLELVHDAIIAADGEMKITFWNHAAERMYGWSQEEALGQNVSQLLRSELIGEERERVLEQSKKTGTFQGESIHYTKDGRRLVIEPQTLIQKDLAGQVSGYISVNRDATERRQAVEALRQSEAVLEAFFANSPGILNIGDDQFRYIKTDPLTPTYFGLDRQSIVGKSIEDLAPEFAEQFGPIMQRVIDTGQPETREVFGPVPSRHGEIAYWLSSYFPVPLPGGKKGIGIMSVEITQLKKAQEERREQQLQVELQRRCWNTAIKSARPSPAICTMARCKTFQACSLTFNLPKRRSAICRSN